MTEQRWPDQAEAAEARLSPVALALAAAALAVSVVAILASTGQASSGAAGESCSDRVNAWAAQMAPQTNGFNNEDIARHAAEVQRAAAEALAQC